MASVSFSDFSNEGTDKHTYTGLWSKIAELWGCESGGLGGNEEVTQYTTVG